MSAKTKIVVLHMKELIYTGIFAALGILLVILLIIMFLPDKKQTESQDAVPPESTAPSAALDTENPDMAAASGSVYIPGVYTTELVLGGQSACVEVIVEEDSISSIQLTDLSDSITTMYPLLKPAFDSICEQIYETQSLEEISYSSDSKYTSLVLLEAIRASLEKASGL